jgi:hypothetical protein
MARIFDFFAYRRVSISFSPQRRRDAEFFEKILTPRLCASTVKIKRAKSSAHPALEEIVIYPAFRRRGQPTRVPLLTDFFPGATQTTCMKQTLPTLPVLPFLLFAFSAVRLNAQCPTVEAVMIDACGPEQFNEFIIIHSGGGFNTANLQVDYDVNNNIIGQTNNDINTNMDNWPADPTPCGLTTGNIGAYTGCPNLIAVGSGANIPANAILVLQTSAGSTAGLYNFAALCSAGQCVFVISSTCVRSAGAFSNAGTGPRTTIVSFGAGCDYSFTYDRAALSNANGDYFLPVSGAYGNGGCNVPPTSPAPMPPVINPIANVTVCSSYTLPPISGTNLTPNAAYFTGPNGTGTQYTTPAT